MREKLIKILSTPIYPHGLADPTEVVADYLLDNDVVPVVRCKDCEHRTTLWGRWTCPYGEELAVVDHHFCCYGERRTE